MPFGIICIIFSIFLLFILGAFKRVPNAVKTIGIIDNIESVKLSNYQINSHNNRVRICSIKYVVDGKEYHIQTKVKNLTTGIIGKQQLIAYNRNNPEQAVVRPFAKSYIAPCFVFILGIYNIFFNW